MFKLFRKKSKFEVLSKKYEKLLDQSHKMMSFNRRESDRLQAEANEVYQQMIKIKADS